MDEIKNLFLKITGQISIKLGTKHVWVKVIQVYIDEI